MIHQILITVTLNYLLRSMALSVSYWSPMEKLILHLSPVARRRTLKNNNQNKSHTSSLGRHHARQRNRSEPQKATSMKNVSNIEPSQIPLNEAKNPLDCDVKTLRLYSINKVRYCTNCTFTWQVLVIDDPWLYCQEWVRICNQHYGISW